MPPTMTKTLRGVEVRRPDLSRLPEVRTTDLVSGERLAIGQCIDRARRMCGWTRGEFAGMVGCDEALVRKYESGEKRPPIDKFLAIEHPVTRRRYWPRFVRELAELDPMVEVRTVLTIAEG
jgi:transcriptional regulator with XRE-family HTH domain